MIMHVVSYIRLFFIGAGLLDGVVFGHLTGPIMALVVVGIFEVASLADERARMRKKRERI
jgi:hypothetical protein